MTVSALALSFAVGGIAASDLHAKAASLLDGDAAVEGAAATTGPADSAKPSPRAFGPRKMKQGDGFFGLETMLAEGSALSGLLGLSSDEMKEALTGGKTLADLAAEQGVDVQDIIDAHVKPLIEKLRDKLDDGSITQAHYDDMVDRAKEHATAIINGDARASIGFGPGSVPGREMGDRPGRMRGMGEFGRGGPRGFEPDDGDAASDEVPAQPSTPAPETTTEDMVSF